MVQLMALVDQWDTIQRGLDPRWSEAQVVFTCADPSPSQPGRVAALLAPAGPVRAGAVLRFYVGRNGPGVGPEAVRRMLARVEAEGIAGTLELVAVSETVDVEIVGGPSLVDAWDAALAVLPADWSDLLCELALTSSDHLDLAALLMGPVNPLRESAESRFRFRVAHTFGYGASAGMVRRCLERVDEAELPGTVRVLRHMSDTHPIGTQGPVWYIDGKAV
jgi:hypothetical protein